MDVAPPSHVSADSAVTNVRPWNVVRALAAAGLLSFAAYTSVSSLRLSIVKPLKGERIDVRKSYDVSAVESDLRMLRQYVPSQGKVGYASEKPDLERWQTRMRVAPLLLDYDWGRYDIVLVDYPVQRLAGVFEAPNYRLIADLAGAQSFARGLRVYRRNH